MKNFIAPGNTVDFVADTNGVTAGTGVLFGSFFGVACTDADAGESYAAASDRRVHSAKRFEHLHRWRKSLLDRECLRISMAARKKRNGAISPARDRCLVMPVAELLSEGVPTVFANEASCRHGLRIGFILIDGERWARADTRAATVVAAALKRLKAVRPRWWEGQPEFCQDGYAPLERYFCLRCGRPIPDERRGFLTAPKYCSRGCQLAAHCARRFAAGEQQSRTEWLAAMAVKRQQARRESSIKCLTCGKPFVPIHRRDANGQHRPRTDRFCSTACYEAALAPRACIICERVFEPKQNVHAQTCSNRCSVEAARRKRLPQKSCEVCGKAFQPWRKAARFCSRECAARSRRGKPNHWRGVPGGTARSGASNGNGGHDYQYRQGVQVPLTGEHAAPVPHRQATAPAATAARIRGSW